MPPLRAADFTISELNITHTAHPDAPTLAELKGYLRVTTSTDDSLDTAGV